MKSSNVREDPIFSKNSKGVSSNYQLPKPDKSRTQQNENFVLQGYLRRTRSKVLGI
jgi:hypothetical protein